MTRKGSDAPAYQEAISRIAYESVCASLTQQQLELRNLRNQASFVAAMNGLIGTFMTNLIFRLFEFKEMRPKIEDFTIFLNMNIATLLALLCFICSLIFAIRIRLPNPGWRFDLKVDEMIDTLCSKGPFYHLVDAYTNLAKQKGKHFIANDEMLKSTQKDLFWALSLSFAQIPFWLFNLL